MKKGIILTAIIIALAAAVFYYARQLNPSFGPAPLYTALSPDAALFMEFDNLGTFRTSMQDAAYGNALSEMKFVKKLVDNMAVLDSIFAGDGSFGQNGFLVSMHQTQANDYEFLFVTSAAGKKTALKDILQSKADSGQLKLSQRLFKDVPIYDIQPDHQKQRLTVAGANNLWLASTSGFLVEESVATIKENRSLAQDTAFMHLKSLDKKQPGIKLYINGEKLEQLAPLVVNTRESDIFRQIGWFMDWVQLDILLSEDAIIFNGYATAGSSKTLSRLSQSAPDEITLTRFLPVSTSMFFYSGVQDFQAFAARPNDSVPYADYFTPWVDQQWCFGLAGGAGTPLNDGAFLIIEAKDGELAAKSMRELAKLTGAEERQERIMSDSLINRLFSHRFLKIRNPFYSLLDGAIIFANAKATLNSIENAYHSDKVLSKDLGYASLISNLSSYANHYFYINTNSLLPLAGQLFKKSFAQRLSGVESTGFNSIGFQFNSYKNLFFTSGIISYSPLMEKETGELWATRLNAEAATQPFIVKNHETKEWEILIQDVESTIYLINKTGDILWSRPADGRMMGNVYQMDFFDNGKLQYLFNTRDKIYLVDRNGNDVAGYPIKLPSPAAAGLLMTEYEERGVYRIFIGAENGNIYGYERGGKPLPGWSPNRSAGVLKMPMQYFVVDGRDYLVALDEKNELHYFNRRGDLRVKKMKLPSGTGGFYVQALKDRFNIYTADSSGNVYTVDKQGAVTVDSAHTRHSYRTFLAGDIDADGKYEYIFADSSRVDINEEGLSQSYTYVFTRSVDPVVFLLQTENESPGYIGAFSPEQGKIYIITSDGLLHSSFPLDGTTPFQIVDDDRKKLLVTGNRSSVVAYEIIL